VSVLHPKEGRNRLKKKEFLPFKATFSILNITIFSSPCIWPKHAYMATPVCKEDWSKTERRMDIERQIASAMALV
jgi:hypothetical protein